MSEMDLHDLLDRHVGNDAWFDAGNGAEGRNSVSYTCVRYMDVFN